MALQFAFLISAVLPHLYTEGTAQLGFSRRDASATHRSIGRRVVASVVAEFLQIIFVFNLSSKKLTQELKSCQTKNSKREYGARSTESSEWKDETDEAKKSSP